MDDLGALIALLPPQYLLYALLLLKGTAMANGFASWLSPLLKQWLGTPSPDDGKAKRFAFWVAKACDFVAFNTRKVADKELIAKLEKQLREKDARIARQLDSIVASEQTIQRQASVIRDSFKVPR